MMQFVFHPVLLLASVFLGVLWSVAIAAGLFGLFLAVPLASATIAYPYALLAATAANQEPPVASALAFHPVQQLGYIAHGAALITLIAVASVYGLHWPAVALIVGAAPASMAVMASTHRLLSAFRPLRLVELAWAIGPFYLAANACLAFVAWMIVEHWYLRVPLAGAIATVHGLLVASAITGRALYRHRERVDLPFLSKSDRIAENRRRDREKAWDNELSEVYLYLSRGETERGYTTLHGILERDGNTLEAWEYTYRRLREWDLPVELSSFARRYTQLLVAAGQTPHALEVVEERLRHDPGFRPFADDADRLAHYAESIGHRATAGLLVSHGGAGRGPSCRR